MSQGMMAGKGDQAVDFSLLDFTRKTVCDNSLLNALGIVSTKEVDDVLRPRRSMGGEWHNECQLGEQVGEGSAHVLPLEAWRSTAKYGNLVQVTYRMPLAAEWDRGQ
jgi:hypothetical protein